MNYFASRKVTTTALLHTALFSWFSFHGTFQFLIIKYEIKRTSMVV